MTTDNKEKIFETFAKEYNSETSIRKYITKTAGYGINYLLQHEYSELYLNVLNAYLLSLRNKPLRILEFGCGAGMNLIRILSILEERRIPVESAYGTDFSEPLIQSARREAKSFLSKGFNGKVRFHVARNEMLSSELAAEEGIPRESLLKSFDLIVGVNTFRYCHRLGKEDASARDIFSLLRNGGVCIIIDMNRRFPLFRSRLRGDVKDEAESYLPSLDEYAVPFAAAGFEILRMDNFCWIPHSAGPSMTYCCRLLTPFLNLVARRYAMRSVVISRKPEPEIHTTRLKKCDR